MKDDNKDGCSNENNGNNGKMKNSEKHETYTHIKKRKFSISSPKLELSNDDATSSPPSATTTNHATTSGKTSTLQQQINVDESYQLKCNKQELETFDPIKVEGNQRQQQHRALQFQQQQQQLHQQQQQYRQHDDTASNLSSSSSSPTGSVSSPESHPNTLNQLANLNSHPYFSPPYNFVNRSNSANQNALHNNNNINNNANNALYGVNNANNNNSNNEKSIPGSPQRRHSENFLQFHQGPQPITPPPPAPQISAAELSLLTEVSATKNGTFQCTLCQKQFGYKNGLIRHVRLTHVGEKPYQCNICNRRFGYKHILMEHQNLHFGNRPYACVQCDKRFAARSNLIQHRTVHKRPYNCSLCNKRFDREDQLKKHLFAHPQMSVIACSSCEYTASSHADYNRHLIDVHRSNMKDSPVSHYNDNNDDDDEDDERDNGTDTIAAIQKIGGHFNETNFDGSSKNNHNNMSHCPEKDKNFKKETSYRGIPLEMNNEAFTRNENEQANQEFDFQNVTVKKEIPENSENLGGQQMTSSVYPQKSFEEHMTPFGGQQTIRLNNEWVDAKHNGQKNVPANKQISENKELFSMWTGANSQQTNQQRQQQQQQVQLTIVSSANHCQLPYIDEKPNQHISIQAALPGIHEVFSKKSQLGSLPSFSNFIPTSNSRAQQPMTQHQDSSQQQQQTFINQELLLSTHQQLIQQQQQQLHIETYSNNQNPQTRQPHQQQSTSQQQQQNHLLNFQPTSNQLDFQISPSISSSNNMLSNLLPTNSTSSSLHQRPTAQLPPITNSTRHTKDQAIQHSVNLNGFPSLDDVLSYYVGQGRLFKCQHCNILFFERGMYFLHSSLHSSPNPWQCSICHKVCSDKNEFTLHFVNQQHNS